MNKHNGKTELIKQGAAQLSECYASFLIDFPHLDGSDAVGSVGFRDAGEVGSEACNGATLDELRRRLDAPLHAVNRGHEDGACEIKIARVTDQLKRHAVHGINWSV